MLSLNTRLLIAASAVLVAFFGLTGVGLDQAFQESARAAVRSRLQAQIYMLLGAADLDERDRMTLPEGLPEARFSTPASGLYAWVVDADGSVVWRSLSLLGMALPDVRTVPAPGAAMFEERLAAGGQALFVLSFAVSWETSSESYRQFVFRVAESHQDYDSQVNQFRRSLWVWLLAAGLLLLLVQGSILRWSLRPLRRVAREIAEIESGIRDRLTDRYPRELRPLTGNLNAFIQENHSRLERHRNALADLAHSLKTPLAVLRSTVEGGSCRQEMQSVVEEQVARMNSTVEYQLQRAAASGRSAMTAPVRVAPLIQKVTDSLAKVYAARGLQFQVRVDEELYFCGDEGDLMEIVGNLADNACKWARRRVGIQVDARTASGVDFILDIDDDGPGIPTEKRSAILDRGERADRTIEGHGIGMAVVRDLVEEVYQGTLEIGTGHLGGAWVRVCLRF